MKIWAPQSGSSGAASAADMPATAAADRFRLSMFAPPAGAKPATAVLVVQHGNSPVEALLQAKLAQ